MRLPNNCDSVASILKNQQKLIQAKHAGQSIFIDSEKLLASLQNLTDRFQAEAEKQAAMARAREAEMVALVQENRAKVVEAEAAVPLAIAEAFLLRADELIE